jgi:hypothetical protein
MENKFRNEMEIKLGGNTILLRPTFENIAAMEENVGSVMWLTWKFSRGVRFTKEGKPDPTASSQEQSIKAIPSLTECAKIIYFNQASSKADDPNLKKYSLEEIWEMVLETGAAVATKVIEFLGKVAAGGKAQNTEEPTESEKKS